MIAIVSLRCYRPSRPPRNRRSHSRRPGIPNMRHNRHFAAGSVLVASLAMNASALAANPSEASLSVGAEYTTGDYGTSQRTRIWYFPVTLEYEGERNRLGITVPYLIVHGPGTVVPGTRGMGGTRSGFAPIEDRTRSGMGDVVVKGSHTLVLESAESARWDLTGKIKFGTAERDKALGTGQDDLGIQVDGERHFGSNGVFGSLGYLFVGDPPGVDYRNAVYGTLGFEHRFGETTNVGIALDGQEAVTRGTPSQLEARLFLSSASGPRTRVTGYVLRGLRDGSPDWGVGLVVKTGL